MIHLHLIIDSWNERPDYVASNQHKSKWHFIHFNLQSSPSELQPIFLDNYERYHVTWIFSFKNINNMKCEINS